MSASIIDSMIAIEKNRVTYDRNKYFRRNAGSVELCSHGRKYASALTPNYMSVTAKIAGRHLESVPIKVGEPIEVDWTEISQKDFNPSVPLMFFGFNASLAGSFNQTMAIEQNLKLIRFWINEGPLIKCLNKNAHSVRNAMAAEGKDARIVSSILIVMETKLAEHFSTNSATSLTVSDVTEGLSITAGSGRVGSKTIQLSDGGTFAYGLHKVRKWGKGKDEINQLEDDWFSFG